ncbi:MAG TPA: PhnD/SsuA/transferrin family substrate-binding protein [Polyangia bacterium]|nr:PhnD/SsuA/transferrin family substrate-binding protein [Polyangia bacterium]
MGAALTFGISRSHAGHDLDAGAHLFADALATRLGRRIAVTVTPDYERLLDGLLVGGVSIAWMPPLLHVRAAMKGAPLACVSQRGGALAYRAALIVRGDSHRTSVRGLRGARAAWADPYSASGYLFPQLHLLAAGVDPRYDLAAERYYGSAAAACRAVADGDADVCAHYVSDRAGAARDERWKLAQLELRQSLGDHVGGELRILDVTDPIPPDGMVLAPPLDGRLQAAARDALLSLHDDDAGARALHTLVQAERLMPVTGDVVKIIARLRAHVPQG